MTSLVAENLAKIDTKDLLKDKVAFVTGAGSGIGRASAIAMARSGAQVIATDIDADKAAQVAGELTKYGFRAVSSILNVTDDAAMSAAIDGAIAQFGRLDILLSHAG